MIGRLLLLASLLVLIGCSNNEEIAPPLPIRTVNVVINMNNAEYSSLFYTGGYAYIANEGIKGILLYRKSASEIIAFERACRHHPTDTCAQVSVASSALYFEDTCCGGWYDTDGEPMRNPSRFPLHRYQTSTSGDLLYIVN